MKELWMMAAGVMCMASRFGVASAAESGKSGHRVVFEIVPDVSKHHDA